MYFIYRSSLKFLPQTFSSKLSILVLDLRTEAGHFHNLNFEALKGIFDSFHFKLAENF